MSTVQSTGELPIQGNPPDLKKHLYDTSLAGKTQTGSRATGPTIGPTSFTASPGINTILAPRKLVSASGRSNSLMNTPTTSVGASRQSVATQPTSLLVTHTP